MEFIPVITLALVAVLLVLVIGMFAAALPAAISGRSAFSCSGVRGGVRPGPPVTLWAAPLWRIVA